MVEHNYPDVVTSLKNLFTLLKVDIKTAIEMGIVINLDNEYEMEIVDDLLKTTCKGSKSPIIGLRVNPVVGSGSIAIISTATKVSKFGLPLTDETKCRIVGLYKKYDWLNGIHWHVGSQGCALELFLKAAEVTELTMGHYLNTK